MFTDSDAEMMARHCALLAELAAWSHELAGDLRGRALAAEDPAERAAYGRAFHDVARSVRQCVALEIRVRRDIRRLERETEGNAGARMVREGQRRRQTARAALSRVYWTEFEACEDFDVSEMIDDMVDEASSEDGFASDPEPEVIRRLEARLREVMTEHFALRGAEAAEEADEAEAAERAAAEESARRDPWAGGDRHQGWPPPPDPCGSSPLRPVPS